jgi:hypothetical protein
MGALGAMNLLPLDLVSVMTNALLVRLQDPKVVPLGSHVKRDGATASLLIMDACIGALIDLHSSDDADVFVVYIKFNCRGVLSEAADAFASRMKVEAALMTKEDRLKCKETLLNLKRFIKYKASFSPSA